MIDAEAEGVKAPPGASASRFGLDGIQRIACVVAAVAVVLALLGGALWKIQAYPSHQKWLYYGAWSLEIRAGKEQRLEDTVRYGARTEDARTGTGRAAWERVRDAGGRTFILLLAAAAALASAAVFFRRAPRALSGLALLAAAGILWAESAFGAAADATYGILDGTFHDSGRPLLPSIAGWTAWAVLAATVLATAVATARYAKANRARAIHDAVRAALGEAGLSPGETVARATDPASASSVPPRRGAWYARPVPVLLVVAGAIGVAVLACLLVPERHDLRLLTYKEAKPLINDMEGATAAEFVQRFGPPADRPSSWLIVRGGEMRFEWEANGGTVTVTFADTVAPSSSLEEHLARREVTEQERLKQLRFVGWSWSGR